MNSFVFGNRRHAGKVLVGMLQPCARWSGALVLALPRGGVPVGFEVAQALQAPLDVFVVRKLATGSTMLAAVRAMRARGTGRLVVAVPTAAADTCEQLRAEADEVACATTPEPFRAVGLWYDDFSQTSDDEVRGLLERALRDTAA